MLIYSFSKQQELHNLKQLDGLRELMSYPKMLKGQRYL